MASIDFNERDLGGREEVGRLLKDFIGENEPLEKFSFECDHLNPGLVARSIRSAINRGIRFLQAKMINDDQTFLPHNLFTCQTLESVELEGNFHVDPPPDVQFHLPRLHHLKLSDIRCEDGNDITRFISGCPVLQFLHLDVNMDEEFEYTDEDKLGYTVSSTTLRRLELFVSSDNIRLELPNLEYATIGAGPNCESIEGMIEALSRTRFLKIISDKAFRLLENEIDDRQFERLRTLALTAECGPRAARVKCKWLTLFNILRRTPNLSNLRFQKVSCSCSSHARWTAPDQVPDCFSSTPTQVSILGYQGFDDEFEVVTYILRQARRVTLHVSKIEN